MFCLRHILIAAALALPLFSGAAQAQEPPNEASVPPRTSLQSAVDDFLAFLKSETNDVMTDAARFAREHKSTLDAIKDRVEAEIAEWRAALSGRKARLPTVDKDAAAMWDDWKETAVSTWHKLARQAQEALDALDAWMRNQSLSESEIPV
jgi:hypothetical protein